MSILGEKEAKGRDLVYSYRELQWNFIYCRLVVQMEVVFARSHFWADQRSYACAHDVQYCYKREAKHGMKKTGLEAKWCIQDWKAKLCVQDLKPNKIWKVTVMISSYKSQGWDVKGADCGPDRIRVASASTYLKKDMMTKDITFFIAPFLIVTLLIWPCTANQEGTNILCAYCYLLW